MVDFSSEQVKKLAKLARIKITDEECKKFSGDLSAILTEIEKLQEVDTKGIIPLSNITEKEVKMRKDEVNDGDILEKVLSNAKNAEFNCYVVPKVIE
jgi:aspartyl-tRNA(Asn)/glutamyl-tRNA(Gln) amidotransferase subunit C